MKIRSQVGMVLNLDKCIGCHTCSITCKNVWTSREGMEYAWFNNVETKPGIGYPKEWENQEKWKGGWVRAADGSIRPRIGGKFRVLERHQFRGKDFAEQAEFIRKVTQRYWVTYIGVDTTGKGSDDAQLVRQFFPGVRTFSYSPEVKTQLVMKAWSVIKNGRLEFDAGWTDLAQALMAIRKTITAGGRQFTYTAGRNDNTGHADLAWALFHALQNEPLEGQTPANTGRMEIF